jgi:hypothetical protein
VTPCAACLFRSPSSSVARPLRRPAPVSTRRPAARSTRGIRGSLRVGPARDTVRDAHRAAACRQARRRPLNVTVVNPGAAERFRSIPLACRPAAAPLSFSPRHAGQQRDVGVVGRGRPVSTQHDGVDPSVDVILDVNGYFVTPAIVLNQPPQVNAGLTPRSLPASANLSGSASDDGLPWACPSRSLDESERARQRHVRQCVQRDDVGLFSARGPCPPPHCHGLRAPRRTSSRSP